MRNTSNILRKLTANLIPVFLILIIMPSAVFAANPTASVTGPSTVRAGDTITVAVNMNGTNLLGIQGAIQYNSSQLTYVSNAGLLSGWNLDTAPECTNGTGEFMMVDADQNPSYSGSKQLFTLTFQVKSIATGTNINITISQLAVTDGTTDFNPSATSYSVNVAAPLSTNANLSSLGITNATAAPAFNAATTSYTASVPFSVTKLTIAPVVQDSKAKTSVVGNALNPGSTTTVTVTVTAENGTKKNYTIKVTRAQDPNYVATSSITPSSSESVSSFSESQTTSETSIVSSSTSRSESKSQSSSEDVSNSSGVSSETNSASFLFVVTLPIPLWGVIIICIAFLLIGISIGTGIYNRKADR